MLSLPLPLSSEFTLFTCSVNTEQADGIFCLAGNRVSFVTRGRWRDIAGGGAFLPGSSVFLLSGSCSLEMHRSVASGSSSTGSFSGAQLGSSCWAAECSSQQIPQYLYP